MAANELPLVSIIIPCYNGAKYLSQSIDSALAQTYHNTEIILINDGSTDGSLNMMQAYAATHPTLIQVINQPNAGVAKARDAAIKIAKGEFILPLDADDFLRPDAIEVLVNYALAHPHFVVVYGDFERVTEAGDVFRTVSFRTEHPQELGFEGNILGTALYHGVACVTSLIRRNKILEMGGYWHEATAGKGQGHEDYFLNLRLILAGYEFGYVEKFVFYYRDTSNSMSKDKEKWYENYVASIAFAFRSYPARMAEAIFQVNQVRERQFEREKVDIWQIVSDRDKELAEAWRIASDRQHQIEQAWVVATDRQRQIEEAWAIASDRQHQIEQAWDIIAQRDQQIANLRKLVDERDQQRQVEIVDDVAVPSIAPFAANNTQSDPAPENRNSVSSPSSIYSKLRATLARIGCRLVLFSLILYQTLLPAVIRRSIRRWIQATASYTTLKSYALRNFAAETAIGTVADTTASPAIQFQIQPRLADIVVSLRIKPEKAEHFYHFYDDLLSSMRYQALNIVEIGVYNGGSLLMFSEYFPNARLLGIDVKAPPPEFYEELKRKGLEERVGVVVGSQDDTDFLGRALDMFFPGQHLDMIIDDASHFYEPTKVAFDSLFYHHLKKSGFYIIEDWECGYWPKWYDGNPDGMHGLPKLVKELVDLVALNARTGIWKGVRALPVDVQQNTPIKQLIVREGIVTIVKN